MAKKPKISVVLMPEVRDLLAQSALGYHIQHGSYLNCDTVEQVGDFLRLEVTAPDHQGKPFTSEIRLPTRFVLYTISVAPEGRRALGFKDDD